MALAALAAAVVLLARAAAGERAGAAALELAGGARAEAAQVVQAHRAQREARSHEAQEAQSHKSHQEDSKIKGHPKSQGPLCTSRRGCADEPPSLEPQSPERNKSVARGKPHRSQAHSYGSVDYDKGGKELIASLGQAAESDCILGTLVFGLACSVLLQEDPASNPLMMMFLSTAILSSGYATTFDLAEYVWANRIEGVQEYLHAGAKMETEGTTQEGNGSQSADESSGESKSASPPKPKSHRDGVRTALNIFESFSNMRQWGDNALWGSFGSIMLAAISKFAHRSAAKSEGWIPLCWQSAIFFGVYCFFTGALYSSGFTSDDVKVYGVASGVGLAISSSVACFHDPDFDMPRLVCMSVMLVGLCAISNTVRLFRGHFAPLVIEYSPVGA